MLQKGGRKGGTSGEGKFWKGPQHIGSKPGGEANPPARGRGMKEQKGAPHVGLSLPLSSQLRQHHPEPALPHPCQPVLGSAAGPGPAARQLQLRPGHGEWPAKCPPLQCFPTAGGSLGTWAPPEGCGPPITPFWAQCLSHRPHAVTHTRGGARHWGGGLRGRQGGLEPPTPGALSRCHAACWPDSCTTSS